MKQLNKQAVNVSAGLSGKAKEAFEDWLFTTRNEEIIDGEIKYDLYYMFIYMLPEPCKNVLIIEFFDSVGVYIEIIKEPNDWALNVHRGNYKRVTHSVAGYNTRQQATNSAIEKAVKIHNTEAEH